MKNAFLAFGVAVCIAFGYANYTGWDVFDSAKAGTWSPHGQSKTYHK
jgi:hypothetical protein